MNVDLVAKARNLINRVGGRKLLQLRKHSPEIMLGVGVVGLVASTVLTYKEVLKVDQINSKFEDDMERIHLGELEHGDKYSEKDRAHDKTVVIVQTGVSYLKSFGPPVALGAVSLGLIFGSNQIMRQRNMALMAGYKVVQEAYKKYRARVLEDVGVEKDIYYRYGVPVTELTVEELDEKGKTVKNKISVVDGVKMTENESNWGSEYAKWFDEMSPYWQKSSDRNRGFLQIKQNLLNDRLKANGHLFLNEVYDELGIPRTSPGAVVGWVYESNGDNFIDFGLFDSDRQDVRDFMNGYDNRILLDFNVDGVIWDLIS